MFGWIKKARRLVGWIVGLPRWAHRTPTPAPTQGRRVSPPTPTAPPPVVRVEPVPLPLPTPAPELPPGDNGWPIPPLVWIVPSRSLQEVRYRVVYGTGKKFWCGCPACDFGLPCWHRRAVENFYDATRRYGTPDQPLTLSLEEALRWESPVRVPSLKSAPTELTELLW